MSFPIQEKALKLGIDLQSLPKHIAIIMDGNGRWAQKRGLGRLLGHRQGYLALKNILPLADQLGIKCLTLYGFSSENWRRSETEVKGLMDLIRKSIIDEEEGLHKNNVQMRLSGHREGIPSYVRDSLEHCEQVTKNNTGIIFNLAINYGGRLEIIDAIKSLVKAGENISELTEEKFTQYLYQPDLPDPELMIRTAGEMRWSNFVIWQSAYTELFVTPISWPEFTEDHLLQAVVSYQKRDRKFGGLI